MRLIDADALRDKVRKDMLSSVDQSRFMVMIDNAPTIEPKQGEWIDWLGQGNEWECSECKCSIESHGGIAYRFCPMCGAKMKGDRR